MKLAKTSRKIVTKVDTFLLENLVNNELNQTDADKMRVCAAFSQSEEIFSDLRVSMGVVLVIKRI